MLAIKTMDNKVLEAEEAQEQRRQLICHHDRHGKHRSHVLDLQDQEARMREVLLQPNEGGRAVIISGTLGPTLYYGFHMRWGPSLPPAEEPSGQARYVI